MIYFIIIILIKVKGNFVRDRHFSLLYFRSFVVHERLISFIFLIVRKHLFQF